MVRTDTSARVTAVLGPTNTGKTYLAIDRMLGHGSGMMGFPLRLLARENYDRVRRLKGERATALITGEERIVPPNPRYFLCTVEAMPLDRRVDFLALDEVQLCTDPERGHIFTERLLRARGEEETMLLGAETIAPIIRKLVPEAVFVRRPRLSRLTYAGRKKLARLPPRSAVIAFSAANLYALAELIRRQRGGTAVVLGALSPRTRNAQVAMYEAGEVDYMVATDAIGMGLNMGINHVAFSALGKFDGHAPRRLAAAEIAQIAGRAGRHMNDGTFGVTGDLVEIEPEIVTAVEDHRFDAVRSVYWRNADLDFRSPAGLKRSLEVRPPAPAMMRARGADDVAALEYLMKDPEIAALATNPAAVRLLWDVCQTPDYRKDMSDGHPRLLGHLYRHLATGPGVIPPDYIARALAHFDRNDGDIDTLVARIAHVRTWTYLSHRADWLDDAGHWQGRARALEDKLSDALHDRLTQRFVDRRSAAVLRRLRERGGALVAGVTAAGDVVVEGEVLGRVLGFRFMPDDGEEDGAFMRAANRALRGEMGARVTAMESDGDDAFSLDGVGGILWRAAPVARLAAGPELLRPGIHILPSDHLDPVERERLRRRLVRWLEGHLRGVLAPLFALTEAGLAGAARGLAFQIAEGGGSVARAQAAAQVEALGARQRRAVARLGVRLGVETIFMPALLKAAPVHLRAQLSAARLGLRPAVVPDGSRVSVPTDAALPAEFYAAAGYRAAGPLAIRVDVLERLLAGLRRQARGGRLVAPADLITMVGARLEDFAALLRAFGYEAAVEAEGVVVTPRRQAKTAVGRRRPKSSARAGPKTAGDGRRSESPFAGLKDLPLKDLPLKGGAPRPTAGPKK